MDLLPFGDERDEAEASEDGDGSASSTDSVMDIVRGALPGRRNGGDADLTATVARTTAAVDYDGLPTRDGGIADGTEGLGRLDVASRDLQDVLPDDVPSEDVDDHARNLSTIGDEAVDENRARRVAAAASRQAAADASSSAYVATYMPVFEGLVDEAFAAIDEGADPADAREALLDGVRASMVDMQIGVEMFAEATGGSRPVDDVGDDPPADDEGTGKPSVATGSGSEITLEEVFEAIPYPAFLVDDEHTVLEYNAGLRRLLSLGDDHREFLGMDNRDAIASATYTDDRRHRSLVDKVAENPRDAEDHWDVERVDDEHEHASGIVYEDTSVTNDVEGNETHIGFLAVPIFDDGGELKAVLELVEDRSEEILHQRTVSALIGEVTDTLDRIGEGDLSARAEFEDDHGVVDPELLGLTDDVNEMAEDFEELVRRVDETTERLTASIESATDSVDRISEQVENQNRSTAEVASQVEDFSAAMEEVATTASEVADAADAALDEADRGARAGEDAREVTEELTAISDSLVETVEDLDEYMDEVGDVVDVISDIAQQTNILALNANIEAARADQSGEGFAVVAEEVKSLATQAQEHTGEIADRIDQIQSHTADTVSEVETSYEYIQTAGDEIENTVDALQTISETVEDATSGIQEVADANDEQAANLHEVMAELDALQESSDSVAETTDDIVDVAENQRRIVEELSDRVHVLSTRDEHPEPAGVEHD